MEERYGYDPREYGLSRIPAWNQFVEAMNRAMLKQYSALEWGGRMAVLMGDIKKKGHLYSMLSEIAKPGMLKNINVMIVRKDVGLLCQYWLQKRRNVP